MPTEQSLRPPPAPVGDPYRDVEAMVERFRTGIWTGETVDRFRAVCGHLDHRLDDRAWPAGIHRRMPALRVLVDEHAAAPDHVHLIAMVTEMANAVRFPD